MILEKFSPSDKDSWAWSRAGIMDVPDIVHLAEICFEVEEKTALTFDADLFAHNLTLGIVNQSFDPDKCLILTARDKTTQALIGYAWLNRGVYMTFSREEIAEGAFIQLDVKLKTRKRITIIAQILQQWNLWCQLNSISILASGSILIEQKAFLNLHKAAGFDIHGSIAYKRIE